MKIQAIKSNITDTLSLSGNILTINDTDYDLENLEILPEDSTPEGCYLDGSGEKIINIKVDSYKQFIFINNNYLLFFDVDLSGGIELDELGALIEHYSLDEAEARKARRAIKDSYTAEEWAARLEACK